MAARALTLERANSRATNQIGAKLSIPSPFWAPDRHADRRPRLLARARAVAAVRAWFGREGSIEVEPAALQLSPGNETHLHGFSTELIAGDGARATAYLHTSPEFAMKKLLAGGETRIFAFARVFRNRERTALHAPEFTMLEWYRVGEDQEALMRDSAAVLRLAAEAAGTQRLSFRGREADPFAEPERLSVREAFLRYAGVDVFAGEPPAPSPLTGEGWGGGENHRAGETERGPPPPRPPPRGGGGGGGVEAPPPPPPCCGGWVGGGANTTALARRSAPPP